MNAVYTIATMSMLLASLGIAKSNQDTQAAPPFSQGLELPSGQYAPGYNAPAFIDVQGWNFDVWGSFTYWNVNQEAMNVGFIFPTLTAVPADAVTSTSVAIGDVWEPGFKVGAACNTYYDGWVGSAEYTWVRSSTSVSVANTTGNPNADFSGTGLLVGEIAAPITAGATQVSSNWKMNLDLLDVLFSRPYYEGTRITTTPFAGLRALFIRQRQTVNMFVPDSDSISVGNYLTVAKTHCWSIGPVAGVSGHWLLGKGFRFEGSTAASLLFTQYTDISVSVTYPGKLTAPSQWKNLNELRPTAEIGLGLGWGSYICNHAYFIDFSARYEFKYLWDQNVYAQFAGALADFGTDTMGALMLHGLTLSGGFDF